MGCCSNSEQQVHPAAKQPNKKRIQAQQSSDHINIRAAQFITQNDQEIAENYTLGKVLGEGAFGKCVIGIHKITGQQRAIKILNKATLNVSPQEHEAFINEVELLKSMDHPGIIRIYEFYEDERSFYIVMDMCQGGEMFDYLVEQEKMDEASVVHVVRQLLGAISYCHERNVVHRDLKPENILLEQKPKGNQAINVKIIDFGTSSLIEPGQQLNKRIGTAYYVAPEVLNGKYDHRCDVWSIGIIAYIMLVGYPPFDGNTDNQILQSVALGKLEFEQEDWDGISADAQDLIRKMLTPMETRISAAEALQHPWMTQALTKMSISSISTTLKKLQNFRADRKLQRAVLSFISSQLMSQDEMKHIRAQFDAIDANGDGKIDRDELIAAYERINRGNSEIHSIDQLLRQIDADGSGHIEYSEFILATMNIKKALSKENLQAAFQRFDKDGSGMISIDELRNMIGDAENSDKVWGKILKDVDQDGNGEIDIKEFQKMMLSKF